MVLTAFKTANLISEIPQETHRSETLLKYTGWYRQSPSNSSYLRFDVTNILKMLQECFRIHLMGTGKPQSWLVGLDSLKVLRVHSTARLGGLLQPFYYPEGTLETL